MLRSHLANRSLALKSRIAGLIAIVMAAGASSAHAQDFYRGKTLNLVIGNTAGSGYDIYGRLVSRFMAKHLPGNPRVTPQIMPGAGSVKAAEYLYSIAPKDGTYFGIVMPGALVDPLANGLANYRYRPGQFEYIGTADSGTRVAFSSRQSPVKTIEDAQKTKAIVAATPRADYARMLNALARTQFQIVTGYPGPADIMLALERGEGDVICALDLNAINTIRPGLLTSGKVNILLQIGIEPNPMLSALGVPEVWKYIAAEDRPLVELIVQEQVFQRTFLAPPGTPAAQVAALRAAFDAALKDPELLDEAKRSNLEINPKSGDQVAALVQKMYAAPKELIERMGKVTRQ